MSGYVPNIPRAKRDAELRNVEPTDHHALQWAQYEQYSQRPSAKPATTEVALRIGVFFDGTGNNATNTALGERCGAHHPIEPEDLDAACKPYMADPDSSYGNDITNVRKLYDLYLDEAKPSGSGPRMRMTRRIYVDGIGTRAGGEDSTLGASLGRGETGVANRVRKAFSDIDDALARAGEEVRDCQITSLIFDIFGFSRGAAAARHFANEVARAAHGPLGAALRAHKKSFSATFINEYQRGIDVGFIGLFDTVAAVGGISNVGNVRSPNAPGLKLYLAPKLFPHVVHLVARDELRANFSLSSVAPDHLEIVLPGAHSDIGGGYLRYTEESVFVSPMQALTVSVGTDIRTTSIYKHARQTLVQMVSLGWPASMLKVATPSAVRLPSDPQDRLAPQRQRVFAGVNLKRHVRGDLAHVYLRLMHNFAEKRSVPLLPVPDTAEHAIPEDIAHLWRQFSHSDYALSDVDEELLRTHYIHFSGHWNHPFGKVTAGGLKVVYINAPNASRTRLIHPHVPEWSLF